MAEFFDSFQNFFEFFLGDGEASFWHKLQAYYAITVLKFKILFLENAWEVARVIITELGVSEVINQYWGMLDSVTLYYMTMFRIPDAISLLLNARITRFVMGLL